jgi:hypothetical protein
MSIKLELEVADVELVLKHLAAGAFIEVSPAICKIRDQALAQINQPTEEEPVVVNFDDIKPTEVTTA